MVNLSQQAFLPGHPFYNIDITPVLDKTKTHLISVLTNTSSKDAFIKNLNDIDFNEYGLNDLLSFLMDFITKDIDDFLSPFSLQQIGNVHMKEIIAGAIGDIFMSVFFSQQCNIPAPQLKGLIYNNMVRGNGSPENTNSIFQALKELMIARSPEWISTYENKDIIRYISSRVNTSDNETEGLSCPFHNIPNKQDFIDIYWGYCLQIINSVLVPQVGNDIQQFLTKAPSR